ncbi:MAG: choice-of-anchor X domain-containing protein [bacterium]
MTAFRSALFVLLVSATCALAQPTVSLYDIQFTTDTTGNSPYAGTTVITGGIVTATNYTGRVTRYFLGDGTGGPWHGIYVFDNADRQIQIGDSVRLQGEVYESSGETRLRNINAANYIRVPNVREIPAFSTYTGIFDSAEAYEGVVAELEVVRVRAVSASYWEMDDGTGTCQVGFGFDYAYEPVVGDSIRKIRGVVVFTSGVFRLEPRGSLDFTFWANQPPTISNVSQTPTNPTSEQAVLVKARIIDESGVASAQLFFKKSNEEVWQETPMYDDGTHGDGAAGDGIYGALIAPYAAFTEVHYYIRAEDTEGAAATNPSDAPEDYFSYVVRSTTLTIFDIRYVGGYDQVTLEDVVVTAVNYDGDNFFVSDPTPGPWHGVYVYGSGSGLNLGDHVRFSARVQDYYGTLELSSVSGLTVISTGNPPLPPLPICATTLGADSGEMYEGCFVELGEGVVLSSADSYGQFRYQDACGTAIVDNEFAYEYEAMPQDSMRFLRGVVTYHSATGHKLDPRGNFDIGIIDKRAPRLLEASAISYFQVNVRFNEALDTASANNLANYTLRDFTSPVPLDLRSVRLFSNQKMVALEPWDSLKTGYTYTLTVSGIADTVGNIIAPDSAQSVEFTGFSERAYASIDSFYDFYELFRDSTLTVCGVVSFMQDVTTTGGSRRISAYIQDGSGRGLNLSESGPAASFPLIVRDNLIEITGTVSDYDGSLQMGGFTSEGAIRLLSEDMPLPEPVVVETGNRPLQQSLIRTSASGVLGSGTWCKITGTILRVDENIGGGTNIYIDDGSGNLTIRVWNDMRLREVTLDGVIYAMRDLEGKTCSIEGVSSQYLGDFQMLAGYAEDFSSAQPTGLPSAEAMLTVEAKPFAPDMGQKINIAYNAPLGAQIKLRVFNLRGQIVATLVNKTSVGPFTISWDGRDELRELLPLGTYIVHLESEYSGKKTTAMKPVVVGTRLK